MFILCKFLCVYVTFHNVYVFIFMFLGLDSYVLQVNSFWFRYGVPFKILFVMCYMCGDIDNCRHQCGNTQHNFNNYGIFEWLWNFSTKPYYLFLWYSIHHQVKQKICFHDRPKHIKLKYHYFREKVKHSEITLIFTSIQDMWYIFI